MDYSRLTLTLAALALLGTGCAKPAQTMDATTPVSAVSTTIPSGSTVGTVGTTTGITGGYGSTATFTPDSETVFNTFVASHPLDSPSNYQLNVNLADVGGGHYAGTIQIGYTDNGVSHVDSFVAGASTNQDFPSMDTSRDVGKYEAEYNTWFNNSQYFTGFFQDSWGGVILVIDGSGPNLGDGQGSTTVSGSVWFKNFPTTFATQSPYRYCWFIYAGPFDCISQTVAQEPGSKTTTVPSDNYERLGTFTGLVKTSAFNMAQ